MTESVTHSPKQHLKTLCVKLLKSKDSGSKCPRIMISFTNFKININAYF